MSNNFNNVEVRLKASFSGIPKFIFVLQERKGGMPIQRRIDQHCHFNLTLSPTMANYRFYSV